MKPPSWLRWAWNTSTYSAKLPRLFSIAWANSQSITGRSPIHSVVIGLSSVKSWLVTRVARPKLSGS